ncbi:MAG: hypothetical protein OXH79_11630 [Boseongicola sp.]|nr:hypothetical protein [Boseongicola sp.]
MITTSQITDNWYFLSFRLKDDTIGNQTYDDRRDCLIDLVDSIATGKYSDDTTSSFVFRSSCSLKEIKDEVEKRINLEHDVVDVAEMNIKNSFRIGKAKQSRPRRSRDS